MSYSFFFFSFTIPWNKNSDRLVQRKHKQQKYIDFNSTSTFSQYLTYAQQMPVWMLLSSLLGRVWFCLGGPGILSHLSGDLSVTLKYHKVLLPAEGVADKIRWRGLRWGEPRLGSGIDKCGAWVVTWCVVFVVLALIPLLKHCLPFSSSEPSPAHWPFLQSNLLTLYHHSINMLLFVFSPETHFVS